MNEKINNEWKKKNWGNKESMKTSKKKRKKLGKKTKIRGMA